MISANRSNHPGAIPPVGIKVVQINLNHCWTAQQLLLHTITEVDATIALISDYHRPMGDDEQWIHSTDGKCAIFIAGIPRPVVTNHGAGLGKSRGHTVLQLLL